jgi:hypothetical protein
MMCRPSESRHQYRAIFGMGGLVAAAAFVETHCCGYGSRLSRDRIKLIPEVEQPDLL